MFTDENTPEKTQEEEVEEEGEEKAEEAEETEEEEEVDWKAEALKYKAILDRQGKKSNKAKSDKSSDFGYDVKAYLKSSGIKADEFDFVKTELKTFKGDLDGLLENEYFQAKLEKHRELKKTSDAVPAGRRGSSVPTDSVEYWMAKPIEEVPQHMRRDVVNARLAQDKKKGKFYNS